MDQLKESKEKVGMNVQISQCREVTEFLRGVLWNLGFELWVFIN